MTDKKSIREQINHWAANGIPFLFIIDFEMRKPLIFRTDNIDSKSLLYDINGITNIKDRKNSFNELKFIKSPESYNNYLDKFNKVRKEIDFGNTYLVNLTCTTPLIINQSLLEVFHISKSKYRIWYNDEFVCFSPEIFVTIRNGVISSFPMKGTIDADIPDAERIIMDSRKETAEHSTIVDLKIGRASCRERV